MRRTSFVALFALAAACKVVPASPDAPGTAGQQSVIAAALRDTVRIPVGRTASFDNGRLTVAFDALEADSRCPADATCVWAGDAAVRLALQTGDRKQAATLHTTLQPQRADYFGYAVGLVNVEPYPGTYDRSKPAPTPVALVVVTRQ